LSHLVAEGQRVAKAVAELPKGSPVSLRNISLASLVVVAACATPSQRITAKLTEYGVPPTQARCMGDRLQQRLDNRQLRRLGEIGRLNRDRLGRMSVTDIAATLNKPGDEALVAEVVRSGISCLI
jgi:hypothetical protein